MAYINHSLIFVITASLLFGGACSVIPVVPQIPVVEGEVTVGGETQPTVPEVISSEEIISRPSEDTVPSLMSASEGDEVVLAIDLGTPAPFTGILLNAEAAAWLEAEPDATHERCQLFLDRRLGEVRVSLLAENERLTLRIASLEATHVVDIRARQEQIDSLLRINEELRGSEGGRTLETVLWVGGGVLVGVGIGVLIGLFAN